MSIVRGRGLLLAVIAVGMMNWGANAAPIVANGGFETGNFSGWSVSGSCMGVGPVNPICNPLDADPGPHSGNYAAYLGAESSGMLSQNLTTTAGSYYSLDFWLAVTTIWGAAIPNSISVSWNGNTIYDAINSPVSPYNRFSFDNLLATSGSTSLVFAISDVPADFVLDGVTVKPIPEPTSLALFGAALAGLGAMRRRRRAKA